jgi:hypothetical protein
MNEELYGTDPACQDGGETKIRFFRSAIDEDFNIVINKPIQYKIKPIRIENQNWSWTLSDISTLDDYTLKAFNGVTMTAVGHTSKKDDPPRLIIENLSLPANNDKFGDQEVRAIHIDSPEITKTNNDKIVRTFFVKNEMNPNTRPPFDPNNPNQLREPTEPNWFYYWKQTQPIQDLLTSSGQVTIFDVKNGKCDPITKSISSTLRYDNRLNYVPGKDIIKNDEFGGDPTYHTVLPSGTWGFHTGLVPETSLGGSHEGCPQELSDSWIITGYSPSIITVGPGAGMIKPGPGGQIQGISAFYETVAHEVNHALFDATHFGVGGIFEDIDNDGYDDNWERAFATNTTYSLYVNLGITFSVCPAPECSDEYQADYRSLGCLNIDNQTGIATINEANRATCNSGTLFEELFCARQSETTIE